MLTIFCILIAAGVIIESDSFSFRDAVWIVIAICGIRMLFG